VSRCVAKAIKDRRTVRAAVARPVARCRADPPIIIECWDYGESALNLFAITVTVHLFGLARSAIECTVTVMLPELWPFAVAPYSERACDVLEGHRQHASFDPSHERCVSSTVGTGPTIRPGWPLT
jgi:hypothetical protein